MRFLSVSFAALAVALGANAQTFMINTPTLVQCQPSLLSWTGGQAPYFLTVEPGGQPNATPIEDLGQQNGTSFTWVVNVPSGQSVSFNLRDSTGVVAQSGQAIIQTSTITSCLNSSGSSSASGGSSSSGASSSTPSSTASSSSSAAVSSPSAVSTPGSTSTPTTPGSSTSSSSRPTSAGSSSSGTAPSTSPTSGASAKVAQVGVAGAVAVALAAFIA